MATIILAVTWLRKPSQLGPWSFLTTGGAITVGDLVITGILCMYQYRYLVYCIAVIPILLLEALFLNLGIFIHLGWTLWHSLGTLLGYSLGAVYWAGSFERRGYTSLHRFLLISSTVLYAMNLWGLLPFGVLGLSRIRMDLVESHELDHVLSSLLQYLGIRTGRFPWSPWVEGLFISQVLAGIGWVDAWSSAHASRPSPIPPWEPRAEATRPEQTS